MLFRKDKAADFHVHVLLRARANTFILLQTHYLNSHECGCATFRCRHFLNCYNPASRLPVLGANVFSECDNHDHGFGDDREAGRVWHPQVLQAMICC
jgi:hypothetical protein